MSAATPTLFSANSNSDDAVGRVDVDQDQPGLRGGDLRDQPLGIVERPDADAVAGHQPQAPAARRRMRPPARPARHMSNAPLGCAPPGPAGLPQRRHRPVEAAAERLAEQGGVGGAMDVARGRCVGHASSGPVCAGVPRPMVAARAPAVNRASGVVVGSVDRTRERWRRYRLPAMRSGWACGSGSRCSWGSPPPYLAGTRPSSSTAAPRPSTGAVPCYDSVARSTECRRSSRAPAGGEGLRPLARGRGDGQRPGYSTTRTIHPPLN